MTPCNTDCLQKLIVAKVNKESPVICETRKFIIIIINIIIIIIIAVFYIGFFSMRSFVKRKVECIMAPSKYWWRSTSRHGVTSWKTWVPIYYILSKGRQNIPVQSKQLHPLPINYTVILRPHLLLDLSAYLWPIGFSTKYSYLSNLLTQSKCPCHITVRTWSL